MDELICTEHDDFVEWRYKGLYVMSVTGRGNLPLSLLEKTCIFPGLEFAKVEVKEERDFLAAFSLGTPLDITVAQGRKEHDTSIVAYSLTSKEKEVRRIVDLFVDRGKVERVRPPANFVSKLTLETETLSVRTYDMVETIVKITGFPIEKVFGEVYYYNFLVGHRGVSQKEAVDLAWKKFENWASY